MTLRRKKKKKKDFVTVTLKNNNNHSILCQIGFDDEICDEEGFFCEIILKA